MPDHITTLAQELAELPPSERYERLRTEVESLSLAERFDLIHRLGVYHHPDSYSGPAATLEETAQLRAALPRIIEERGIRTMLDIPCGDFAWMRHVELKADYTGADVVPELANANQQRYGNEKRRFVVLDATKDRLPRVDLIHCRDLLIHLSIADCRAALKNFIASGSQYLLTSHFAACTTNDEIVSGDFRPINLTAPPFGFPPPLEVINEESNLGDGAFRDRSMALWKLTDLG